VNPSTAQATVIVDELIRTTVSHVVLCPGSRNAPLAYALHDAAEQGKVRLHVRLDERGAAFLALGIAARTRRPAVVICTSGTAAANFHPAVLEADRAAVPLIVITADRTPEARAAGVSQVIDQNRLYGGAVRYFHEFAVADRKTGQNAYWRSQIAKAWSAARDARYAGPVHLNIPFLEPLVPDLKVDSEPDSGGKSEWPEPLAGREDGARWTELPESGSARPTLVPSAERGLILTCEPGLSQVWEWAQRHDWPVISETGGLGLGGTAALSSGLWLLGASRFLAEHKPEQVLCVGRPTVFRQVQSVLSDNAIEVLLVRPDSEWPTPAHNVRQVGEWFKEPIKSADSAWLASWRQADRAAAAAVRSVLAEEPWPTGLHIGADLVESLPSGALLTVGSSNPTRDVALAGGLRPDVTVLRNRGVAGIDGTVSTAIGAAIAHRGPAYAFMGDLTFLHDVNALLIAASEERPNLTIVVLNDDGGGIFSLLEQGASEYAESFERLFGTPQGADLRALCAGCRVPHSRVRTSNELKAALRTVSGLRVVEIQVDRRTRRRFRSRLSAAVDTAVDRALN
jgi:2-succinyl-5-enolpyruvyl-6-hydroxy-3-cyclohexene-1-carboxylate synthase